MPTTRYIVSKSPRLAGEITVPGDKSIGHRSLIFTALAEGKSRITGLSGGLDNVATEKAFASMGVSITRHGGVAEVEGVGLRGLRMPTDVVDCGNSGTSMRLLSGLLSAQHFGTRLTGDESLTGRPMGRVIEPLRARGAHIAGSSGNKEGALYPPISIAPLLQGESLSGIEFEMPIASAQVKSAMLLSGLYASGPTAIREPFVSRDHTERMMLALGVPLQTAGPMVVLDPTENGWRRGWDGVEWAVPGDPSSAAFPLLAALMVEGSEISIDNVCVNPTRTGLFDLLRTMGLSVDIRGTGSGAGDEPIATLSTKHQKGAGTLVGGEILVRMIDEVPALCALAATRNGRTEIRDAKELRVKESDRIAVMANVLQKFGVPCEELEDGMIIEGGGQIRGAHVQSHGDHRIAMAAVLLGLVAEGKTVVDDVACVETSFPGFATLFASLGAHIEEEKV